MMPHYAATPRASYASVTSNFRAESHQILKLSGRSNMALSINDIAIAFYHYDLPAGLTCSQWRSLVSYASVDVGDMKHDSHMKGMAVKLSTPSLADSTTICITFHIYLSHHASIYSIACYSGFRLDIPA